VIKRAPLFPAAFHPMEQKWKGRLPYELASLLGRYGRGTKLGIADEIRR
jgi:hypothetical protein